MKITDIINKDIAGKELLQYKSQLLLCDEFKDINLELLNSIENISYTTIKGEDDLYHNKKLTNILDICTYKLSDIKFNKCVRLYAIIIKNNELYIRCTKNSII